jgi:hypothetical protein
MQQPLETTVKTYDNPKEYHKDAPKMARDGWSVQQTSEYQPDRSLAGKLFVPFGMITKPAAKLVVTYQRPVGSGMLLPQPMPAGLSFKEQVKWHMEDNKRKHYRR